MPISEEKKMILKMLEEGKITSEEAARLLEALEPEREQPSSGSASGQRKQSNFQDEVYRMRERINEWRNEFKNNCNYNDFDRAVEDFALKAEKLGKNVASTTFGIVDKMIDFIGSFIDTNSFNIFGNYKTVERDFEAYAADGSELFIEGINGQILVKKHLENKILIRSKVRSPLNNADSILVFSDDGGRISMSLNKMGNISVSHEVFLPAVKFKSIKFETSNGKIYVEDSISENLICVTKNGHIELMGVNSDAISVSTKNAKIQIGYVIGRNIEVNTTNSLVDIKHVKTGNLKALTTNGKIFIENVQNLEDAPEIIMDVRTTNSGIKINMDDTDNRGYKIKAQTTNGGINILIPEMIYHNTGRYSAGPNLVEAESNGFAGFPERVIINALTTNGYIEIVK